MSTSKTIEIPILDDATTEPDEAFTVALFSSNRESLGNPFFLTVTVQDHATILVLSIDFLRVIEGDPGTKTEGLFIVRLSALTSRPISGNYVTKDSTALPIFRTTATGGPACNNPGVDYEGASGTFSFPPGGSTTFTIPVKVCGDAIVENDESFLLVLTDVSSGVQGISTSASIVDDDALQLVKEEGPNPGSATEFVAALDAVLGLRGPFRLTTVPEWFAAAGGDRRTRVVLFAKNLHLNPGDLPSSVLVRFEESLLFTIPAEDVRSVPNTDLTQVVVRLPDLRPGNNEVRILFQTQQSNVALIKIIQ